MPEAIVIAQFERRLLEMGCPSRRLKENIHELAEHFEDLKQAAVDEGLTEREAEARAAAQLGDPIVLAENAVMILRQSSWWGRHPIVGFCLVPIVAFQFAWTLCVVSVLGTTVLLGKLFGPAYALNGEILNTWRDHPEAFNGFTETFNVGLRLSALLLVIFAFCRLARHVAAGLKWTLALCVSCAAMNFVGNYDLKPRIITCGFSWPGTHWFYAAAPLVVAVALVLDQWRLAGSLPVFKLKFRVRRVPATVQRIRIIKTPTFWITTVLGLVFAWYFAKFQAYAFTELARQKEIHSQVWPAERAATLARIKKQERTTLSGAEKMINLKPCLNAALTDSIETDDHLKDNNLAQLPKGIHAFAGVPFDVEGKIQLADGASVNTRSRFPARVAIPVHGLCSRFYLLHGAAGLDHAGGRIAWLTLHYRNGSHAQLDITGGKDVLDWWGPIYNTDAGDDRNPTSAETELAWAGSNPAIKEDSPAYSLRLYRTTFINPHPDLEISSIDYVSSLSGASPFLVGLTLETP